MLRFAVRPQKWLVVGDLLRALALGTAVGLVGFAFRSSARGLHGFTEWWVARLAALPYGTGFACLAVVLAGILTGVAWIVRLTGQLDAALPLLATAIGATAGARLVGGGPIYDALGARLPELPAHYTPTGSSPTRAHTTISR